MPSTREVLILLVLFPVVSVACTSSAFPKQTEHIVTYTVTPRISWIYPSATTSGTVTAAQPQTSADAIKSLQWDTEAAVNAALLANPNSLRVDPQPFTDVTATLAEPTALSADVCTSSGSSSSNSTVPPSSAGKFKAVNGFAFECATGNTPLRKQLTVKIQSKYDFSNPSDWNLVDNAIATQLSNLGVDAMKS